MRQYHALLKEILRNGDVQFEPRTQEYILGISGEKSDYYMQDGFPLITTKNIPARLPFGELFWKLRGERSALPLVRQNIHFWTKNAFDKYLNETGQTEQFPKHTQAWNDKFELYKKMLLSHPESVGNGDLGPVYGYQWRNWPDPNGEKIDQLEMLIERIRSVPGSRYHTLSTWNVANLPTVASGREEMAIGPCPFWHQFSVWANGYMDLAMAQRSCDIFLGVPMNIAQDALLLHMVANETGFKPRKLTTQLFNVHAYLGVPPRSDFWENPDNVTEFQRRFRETENLALGPIKYLNLRDWYLSVAHAESEGNEGKDHIPFILTQLSKMPGILPTLEIKAGIPLLDAIEMPAIETEKEYGYAKIIGYNPAKWDSKADMAA